MQTLPASPGKGRYLWVGAIVLSGWGVREVRRQDRLRILEWSLGSALIVLGLCVFVEFGLQLPLVMIQEALARLSGGPDGPRGCLSLGVRRYLVVPVR